MDKLVYPLIAILSLAVLGLSYKLCDHWKCDRKQANMVWFGVALVPSALFGATQGIKASPAAGLLGVMMGCTLYTTIILFRESAAKGPISISYSTLQLSLVIPVVASLILWGETPSLRHVFGVCLIAVAIVFFGVDLGRRK